MKPTNLQHIQTVCPECKGTDILHDPEHYLTYCTKCGLVIQDNTHIFRVTIAIQEDKIEEKRLRNLWLRKREKSLTSKKKFHQ